MNVQCESHIVADGFDGKTLCNLYVEVSKLLRLSEREGEREGGGYNSLS